MTLTLSIGRVPTLLCEQNDETPLVVALARLRELNEPDAEALDDSVGRGPRGLPKSAAAAEMAAVVEFLQEQGAEEGWRRDDPSAELAQAAVADKHTFGC